MNNFAQDLIESCFLQIGRLPRHEKLKLEEGRKKNIPGLAWGCGVPRWPAMSVAMNSRDSLDFP